MGFMTSLPAAALPDIGDLRTGVHAIREGGAVVTANELARRDGSDRRSMPRGQLYVRGAAFVEALVRDHGIEARDRALAFPGAAPLWSEVIVQDGYDEWERGYAAKTDKAQPAPPAIGPSQLLPAPAWTLKSEIDRFRSRMAKPGR